MSAAGELTCQEVVELVTDYLEDALAADERRRLEEHLRDCPACITYLEQIRLTRGSLRGLAAGELPPHVRDDLLAAFRGWRAD